MYICFSMFAGEALSLTAASSHFQLPDPPAEKNDLRLVIMASAPQSKGMTRAYSKAVSI